MMYVITEYKYEPMRTENTIVTEKEMWEYVQTHKPKDKDDGGSEFLVYKLENPVLDYTYIDTERNDP